MSELSALSPEQLALRRKKALRTALLLGAVAATIFLAFFTRAVLVASGQL
jgi:hypothetical protein